MWDTLENSRFSFSLFLLPEEGSQSLSIEGCLEPLSRTILVPASAPHSSFNFSIIHSYFTFPSSSNPSVFFTSAPLLVWIVLLIPLPNFSLSSVIVAILPVSGKASFPIMQHGLFPGGAKWTLWNQGTPSILDLSFLCQNMLCSCKLCRQR